MPANQAIVIDFSRVAQLDVADHMEVEQEAPVVPVKANVPQCSPRKVAAKTIMVKKPKAVTAKKATPEKPRAQKPTAKTVIKKTGDIKRPKNPFVYFKMLEEKRVIEQYEMGSQSTRDVIAKLAELWRAMSTEERAPFVELSAVDKKRFEEQVANGLVPTKLSFNRKRVGKDGAVRAAKVRRNDARRTDPDMPKKPRLTYLIFVAAKRQAIEASLDSSLWENATGRQRGLVKNAAISKKTGEMWKGMSEEERAPYKAEADADRQRYEREMTVYLQKAESDATCDAWSTIPEPQPMDFDEEEYVERG